MALLDSIFAIDRTADVAVYINGFLVAAGIGETTGNVKSIDTSVGFPQPVPTCDMTFPRIPEWVARKQDVRIDAGYDGELTTIFTGVVKRRRHTDQGDNVHCVGTTNVLTKLYRTSPLVFLATPADEAIVTILAQVPFVNYDIDPVVGTWTIGEVKPAPLSGSPLEMVDKIAQVKGNRIYESRTGQFRIRPLLEAPAPTPAFLYTIGAGDPVAGETISDLSLAAIDTDLPLGDSILRTKIVFSGVEATATSYAKLISVGVRRVGNPRDGIRLSLRTDAGLLLASTRIFRGALLDDVTYTDLQLPLLTRPLLTNGNTYQLVVERADPMILTGGRAVEDFDNHYEVGADSTHSMGGLGVVVLDNQGIETDSFDYDLPFTLAQQTLGEARVLSVADDEDEDQVKKFVTVVGDTLAGVDGQGNAIQVPITGEAFTNSLLLSPQDPELLAMTAELTLIQNVDLADEEALRLLDKNHRIVDTCEVGVSFNPLLELGQTIGLDDFTITKKTGNWWMNSYSHHLSSSNCNSAMSLFGGDQSGTSGIVLPHPDFTYTAEQELIGSGVQTAVTFDGSASTAFDGQIVLYHWTDDYSGGAMDITTAEPRLTRIYNAAVQSSIQVQLEVTGSTGGTRAMTRTINITTSNLSVVTPSMSEAAGPLCMLSLSGGASWTDVATPSGNAVVTAITYDPSAPEDPMMVMYGTDDGNLYRTTDDLATLPLVLTDPDGERFTSIVPNVIDRAVVYASTVNKVYVSLDFGATWGMLADFNDSTYWALTTPGHSEAGPIDPRPINGLLVSEPVVGRIWAFGGRGGEPASWFITKLLSDPPKVWYSDVTSADVAPRGGGTPVPAPVVPAPILVGICGQQLPMTSYWDGVAADGTVQDRYSGAVNTDGIFVRDFWAMPDGETMFCIMSANLLTAGQGYVFAYTDDGGATWHEATSNEVGVDLRYSSSLAGHGVRPYGAQSYAVAADGTIFLATSLEAISNGLQVGSIADGDGTNNPTRFWKSTDGGHSFDLLFAVPGFTTVPAGEDWPLSPQQMAVSADSQVIMVIFGNHQSTSDATDPDLAVSDDGGATWSVVTTASFKNASQNGYEGTLVAADGGRFIWHRGSGGSGNTWKPQTTDNNGSTWADSTITLTGYFIDGFAVSRWHGGNVHVISGIKSGSPNIRTRRFWLSTDDGSTWAPIAALDALLTDSSTTNQVTAYDYDPVNDRLYIRLESSPGDDEAVIEDVTGSPTVTTKVGNLFKNPFTNVQTGNGFLQGATSEGIRTAMWETHIPWEISASDDQTVVSAMVSNRASGDLGLLFASPTSPPANAYIYAQPFYPAGTVNWQDATGDLAGLGSNGVAGAADNNQLQQFGVLMANGKFYATADGVAFVETGTLLSTGEPHHLTEINAWKGIYFASTDDGIEKSVDAGATWEFFRPKGSPFDTTWPGGSIGHQMYFEYRPPQSFNIWLSVWGGGSTATMRRQGASGWVAQSVDGTEYPYCRIHDFGIGRLYRTRNLDSSDLSQPFETLQQSDDEGASWVDVTDVGTCSDIAHGASGVLWALGGGADPEAKRVFKSVDGGDTWTEEYDGSALDPIYRCIAADVFDPRRIIAIGWNGVVQAMLVTLDEGGVWNDFEPAFDSFAQHTDMRLVLGQNNRIIVAYDASGGQVSIEVSDNEGLTWVPKHTFSGAVKVTALFQGGAPLYCAYEGGVARSVDNGETWSAYAATPSPGDEHTLIWSPQDNILYLGADPGQAVSQLRDPATLPGTWVDCSTGIDAAAGFTARACVDGLENVS